MQLARSHGPCRVVMRPWFIDVDPGCLMFPERTEHPRIIPGLMTELDRLWVIVEGIEHVGHMIPAPLKSDEFAVFVLCGELEGHGELEQNGRKTIPFSQDVQE